MRTHRLTWLSTCWLALAACATPAADDEGGETETETGDPLADACGEQSTSVLDTLDQIPPGFDRTVTEIIAELEGDYEGSFSWFPDGGGNLSTSHAGTESALSAALHHQGGEVRLIEVERVGMWPEGAIDDVEPCTNFIDIELAFDFSTGDGLFAESTIVPMRIPGANTLYGAPTILMSLDFAELMGSLGLADFSAAQGTITDIVLGGTIVSSGFAGSLNIEADVPEGLGGVATLALFDSQRVP